MTPLDLLLSRLPGARKSGSGWMARCPAHDDRHASLSVSTGDDGRVLLHCHAGCDPSAIMEALGLSLSDLFPARDGAMPSRNGKSTPGGQTFATAADAVAALERRHGPRSAIWTYRDAAGDPVGLVVRWDTPGGGKEIRPVARRADGWQIGGMSEPRPLYRLPDLLTRTSEPVYVVEGEKCADALAGLGLPATTSPHGSGSAGKADWSPLAGREVVLLPDHDAAGERYALEVARLVHAAGARKIHLLRLAEHAPGLPAGGDIADVLASPNWCGIGLGDAAMPEDFVNLLCRLAEAAPEAAPEWTPAQAVGPWRHDDADDLAYCPFPVDALPAPIRGFVVAASRAIGCDESFIALPLLSALASAIGNTRRVQLKQSWTEPAIVWTAIVGDSGTLKSPALEVALRAVRKRQHAAIKNHVEAMEKYQGELLQWEKEIAAWKRSEDGSLPPLKPEEPRSQRTWCDDVTVEALAAILQHQWRGLLLARDELSGWLGSFDRYVQGKGGDAAKWLEMFGGRSMVVDRKSGPARTIYIPRAAVSVCGGIQPVTLARALGTEHRENGLAARLLLACPPRRPKRWTEADIPPDLERDIAAVFDRLYDLAPTVDEDGDDQPVIVPLSADGKAAWVDFYDAHGQEQVELSGDLASAWSKLEGYAARLALVVHFVRWAADDPTLAGPDEIDADSIAAGVKLSRWFGAELRRVYAILSESDEERDRRRLVELIQRRGGKVTPRDVQMGCRWLRGPGAAEAALDGLVRGGHGSWEAVPSPVTGGHPRRVFTLSTLARDSLGDLIEC